MAVREVFPFLSQPANWWATLQKRPGAMPPSDAELPSRMQSCRTVVMGLIHFHCTLRGKRVATSRYALASGRIHGAAILFIPKTSQILILHCVQQGVSDKLVSHWTLTQGKLSSLVGS